MVQLFGTNCHLVLKSPLAMSNSSLSRRFSSFSRISFWRKTKKSSCQILFIFAFSHCITYRIEEHIAPNDCWNQNKAKNLYYGSQSYQTFFLRKMKVFPFFAWSFLRKCIIFFCFKHSSWTSKIVEKPSLIGLTPVAKSCLVYICVFSLHYELLLTNRSPEITFQKGAPPLPSWIFNTYWFDPLFFSI